MSSRQMDPQRTLETEVPDYGDLSVPWEARLIQPLRYAKGSAQVLVVSVSAPIVLDHPVSISVGGRYEPATWQGSPSQRRTATVILGDSLAPSGLATVRVKVHAGLEAPVLRAGTIKVTR